MKSIPPINWEAIVSAYRADTAEITDPVPFGMATRVVAAWRVARRDQGLRIWTRWSCRAAVASSVTCALIMAWSLRTPERPSILIPTPAANWLTPPLSPP